ncbi:NusG domain II-containing protein [Pseudobutyrivibrio ruminis]|uniref:NusG domain II-containing protein n=1 Tax=Pseudobutyrivibrio ruminis TaxID=46206 RepID=UPI00041F641C|nr:NusG domain II-containing protein [Pseudobutyrivibrio ruminis]
MKKNDIILIICILVVAGLVIAMTRFTNQTKNGDEAVAVVTIDGIEYARYPLDKDVTETIEISDNNYNVISIHDGQCEISDASCPDQICVYHNPIENNGQTIVCLPNRLVVTIENGSDNDIDGATY